MAVLALLSLDAVSAAQDTAQQQPTSVQIDGCPAPSFPLGPVYRIPLRVHLGESRRNPEEFKDILDEINHIWLSQAGIFFVMQVVLDDEPLEQGMDIWFMPVLQGGSGLNGSFLGNHDIQVRDTPLLKPAEYPARHPAARTAAHECGHGLSLPHRQDSDDNLMQSKTYGWQLNAQEIRDARKAAAEMALPDVECRGGRCCECCAALNAPATDAEPISQPPLLRPQKEHYYYMESRVDRCYHFSNTCTA